MSALNEYLWIAVTGTVIGFFYAFGIGANDVANAFATSVSSKSISLRQAVVIAAIFEFAGALFLGASVTSTVRGKIFDTDVYEDQPEVVMLGFMTSLVTASIMLLGATAFGMPVSTTHTVCLHRRLYRYFAFMKFNNIDLTHITGSWRHCWLLLRCRRL
jgi:phosphate/sulfate permease